MLTITSIWDETNWGCIRTGPPIRLPILKFVQFSMCNNIRMLLLSRKIHDRFFFFLGSCHVSKASVRVRVSTHNLHIFHGDRYQPEEGKLKENDRLQSTP